MLGFWFGIVYFLNESFFKGFGNVNILQMVFNFVQWVIGELMKDYVFFECYIVINKVCFIGSYKVVVRVFWELEVFYVFSCGSLFVWVDFFKYLKEDSEKGQEDFWMDIYYSIGILLMFGVGFQYKKYGVFRIVYIILFLSYLEVVLEWLKIFF